jgi:hypothetical protein
MRGLASIALGIVLVPPAALADGMSLAGSLWQCTRATDQSRFVITFYPGGGVGGGELENDEVSPYIFDASRTKPGDLARPVGTGRPAVHMGVPESEHPD